MRERCTAASDFAELDAARAQILHRSFDVDVACVGLINLSLLQICEASWSAAALIADKAARSASAI